MNYIKNIDCINGMKELEKNSIDLLVTSPPYDNLRTYNDNIHETWNFDVFKDIADEIKEVMTDDGVLCWVVGDATIKGSETGSSFKQAIYFDSIGLHLIDTIIYEKNSAPFPAGKNGNRYTQTFEYIFVFSKNKNKIDYSKKIPFEDKNKHIIKGDLKTDIQKTFGDVVYITDTPPVMEKGEVSVLIGNSLSDFKKVIKMMENGFLLHDTMISAKNGKYTFVFILSYKQKPKYASLFADKKNRWAGSEGFGTTQERKQTGELVPRKKKIVAKYGVRNNIWYFDDKDIDNIWKYNTGGGFTTKDKIALKHPAMFPEKLAEDLIRVFSKEGDTVLDIFLGSGTTVKIAKKLNRKYIGFDISKEYIDISNERLKLV